MPESPQEENGHTLQRNLFGTTPTRIPTLAVPVPHLQYECSRLLEDIGLAVTIKRRDTKMQREGRWKRMKTSGGVSVMNGAG